MPPASSAPSGPTTQSVSGKVVGCDTTYIGVPPTAPSPEPTAAPCVPGTGLAGVTITIGSQPPAGVGGAVGGTPANPLPTVTTAADGSFTVPNVPMGTAYIQASALAGAACAEGAYLGNLNATPSPASVGFANSGNFAVLNGQISVPSSAVLLVRLSAMTQDELCYSRQALLDRATILGTNVSLGPTIDEYLLESARAIAVGADTTGVFVPASCNNSTSSFCNPQQFGPQYTLNGGLYFWEIGSVLANSSWQSSEYETVAGVTNYMSSNCITYSICATLTRPNAVFVAASEGPKRQNFFILSAQH